MRRRSRILEIAAVSALAVVGLTPAFGAGDQDAQGVAAAPVRIDAEDIRVDASCSEGFPADATCAAPLAPEPLCLETRSEIAGLADPRPVCFPTSGIHCGVLPVPVGGTCSCSTAFLDRKCRDCDGNRGFLYQTTCTVCPGCTNPPCDLQACYTRSSLFCN